MTHAHTPIAPPVALHVPMAPVAPAPVRAVPVRVVDSRELLGNDIELNIDHHGVMYRLRVTSLGKLILTK